MKITRKNTGKLLLLFAILPLTTLFSSCEESSIDDRDEFVGSYDYEIKAYLDDGQELIYIGGDEGLYDVTGTCQIRKNLNYSDVIDFVVDGEVFIQGENVRHTDNSIVFDVPLQEFWLGNALPVQVRGLEYWDVGNSSYHAAYLYNDESVQIALAAEIMDVSSDLTLLFIAYRK